MVKAISICYYCLDCLMVLWERMEPQPGTLDRDAKVRDGG